MRQDLVMARRKRRKFTPEFKAEAVRLARAGDLSEHEHSQHKLIPLSPCALPHVEFANARSTVSPRSVASLSAGIRRASALAGEYERPLRSDGVTVI